MWEDADDTEKNQQQKFGMQNDQIKLFRCSVCFLSFVCLSGSDPIRSHPIRSVGGDLFHLCQNTNRLIIKSNLFAE